MTDNMQNGETNYAQLLVAFYKNCSEKFHKVHKKTPELISNINKNGRHFRCVPANFENFDRLSFSQNTAASVL